MLDLVFFYKLTLGAGLLAWFAITIAILPWSEREILALRRTGIAAGAVLAAKARAAWDRVRS
jgi:hypothetical protein